MGTEFALARVKLSLQPQMQTVKKTSWFIFVLLLAVSCLDDPDCFQLNNDFIGVVFRVMGSNRLDSVALVSVKGNGKIFTKIDTSVTTGFDASLDFFQNQTEFIIQRANGPDTLILSYQSQTQFVSEDCGPRYILSDLSVMPDGFSGDSVRVVNRTPSRSGGRHIEIFRCPKADTLGITFKEFTLVPAQTIQGSRNVAVVLSSVVMDNGTILYPDTASTIHLPVNLTEGASVTHYTFNFAGDYGWDMPTRNLGITYELGTDDRFEAPCGILNSVTDLDLSEHTFDFADFTRDADGVIRNQLYDPIESNIEVFRCPQTNLVQLMFRATDGTITRGDSVGISAITLDYTPEIFYADTWTNVVRLPLNIAASSTVITIQYGSGTEDTNRPTETFTVNYTRTDRNLYRGNCGGTQVVITGLTVTNEDDSVSVLTDNIQYPPVNNIAILNAILN